MNHYTAPLSDINAILDALDTTRPLTNTDIDADTRRAVLEEAARLAEDTLAPINRIGDLEGVWIAENRRVTMPTGFLDAYRVFCNAGWMAAGAPAHWGGQPLPMRLIVALQDIWSGANAAFALLPMLNFGVITTLDRLGSDALKQRYLPKLVDGTFGGAMVLTEPNAGSDFSALSTRAVLDPESGADAYRLSGQKIFITYGDHDLTDNIIHLTLARTSHAGGSLRGLSLFLVPKYLDDGQPNAWHCPSIEHKMGIRAAPTATIVYDGALGYRIGKAGRGLEYFYGMMRLARFFVGVQALSISQTAYQFARAYAQERRQGRLPGQSESVPIIAHPDVLRMLTSMNSRVDAMRALIYDVAGAMDTTDVLGDDADFQTQYADLMIPVIKSWCTDQSVELTSLAIQVHGGIGYVEDAGIAQYFRDARIGPIYEGTNGIQAIDVIIRRTVRDRGHFIGALLEVMQKTIGQLSAPYADKIDTWLTNAVAALSEATEWIVEHAQTEADAVLLIASDYVSLLGWTVSGWRLICQYQATGATDAESTQNRLLYYLYDSAPHIQSLKTAVTCGVHRWACCTVNAR